MDYYAMNVGIKWVEYMNMNIECKIRLNFSEKCLFNF